LIAKLLKILGEVRFLDSTRGIIAFSGIFSWETNEKIKTTRLLLLRIREVSNGIANMNGSW
jgi:hypothetical protein